MRIAAFREGDHGIDRNLILRVRAGRPAFVFRYTAADGRRREMGFGPCTASSIRELEQECRAAKENAIEARELICRGVDPIDQRAKRKADARKERQERSDTTLLKALRRWHETQWDAKNWSAKYAREWIYRAEHDVPQWLLETSVYEIDSIDVMVALEAAGVSKARQAVMRQRIDVVCEWLIRTSGLPTNPAGVRRNMNEKHRGQFVAAGPV